MGSILEFPPPALSGIDWNNLGLGNFEVNGHIESRYSVATGKWSHPKLVKDPEIGIHGLSTALNYGQQAYEGLKGDRVLSHVSTSIYVLRSPSKRVIIRQLIVMRMASIPPPPASHFEACVLAAVAANAEFVPPQETGANMYIRPVIFNLSGHLPLSPPQENIFCTYVRSAGAYLGGAGPLRALVLDEFDRAAPRGTGSAKIGGNYAPVMPWSERARREGYALTLHLDSRDEKSIDEFSSCGLIGIQRNKETDGYRMIVPESNNAVKSVTSDSCVKLAQKLGWAVEKRRNFNEVLAVGTAVAIASVGSITRLSTNDKLIYSDDGKPVRVDDKFILAIQNNQGEEMPYSALSLLILQVTWAVSKTRK
ncbi:branched-chain amino acid aminotransferase [Xylariales sp. PMI_506]|nr:branched-chain amino acid aminotransferase [Xylariales sp. PMI_506]